MRFSHSATLCLQGYWPRKQPIRGSNRSSPAFSNRNSPARNSNKVEQLREQVEQLEQHIAEQPDQPQDQQIQQQVQQLREQIGEQIESLIREISEQKQNIEQYQEQQQQPDQEQLQPGQQQPGVQQEPGVQQPGQQQPGQQEPGVQQPGFEQEIDEQQQLGITEDQEEMEISLVMATDLIGRNVISQEQEQIGQVEDLLIDLQSGGLAYAIVSIETDDNGLDFGADDDNRFAVSPRALRFTDPDEDVVMNIDRQTFQQPQDFAADQWTRAEREPGHVYRYGEQDQEEWRGVFGREQRERDTEREYRDTERDDQR